ncbi:MAG TPA: M3 family oligoendopeptidase [Chitinophagaceae bacterium]|nr:M3 family oligoendopeptidase [Chitinophagaceae bacterium]
MDYTADIKKIERRYFPGNFTITTWEALEPYFKELVERPINSVAELEQWIKDINEADAITNEDACWRQIKMTCDTENKQLEESFNFFYTEILPKMQPYVDKLNRKLVNCTFTDQLDKEKYYTYLRSVKKNIELFRENNIPIQSELAVLQQQYGAIAGKMTVVVNNQEYTLQQASKFLENENRHLREEVYRKIFDRRLQDKEAMNDLFNKLVEKRNQLAINTGLPTYTIYRFKELGRFDYTEKECFQFHEAVKQYVLPLVNKIYERKKKKLGVETLRPWDLEAQPPGIKSLNPFTTGRDLLNKTIQCLNQINPFFGDCIAKMDKMGHLDLESRKGKAPGGYNCPLAESGAPFIFMNAAGQMDDVTTMVHEGGHAVHSFLAHSLELNAFKDYPTEIAEVASMSMELFSMSYWNTFFDSKEDLKRAKEHQLERVITIFPWIATIDKFQHWLYAHPKHTEQERTDKWMEILKEFSPEVIDYSGLENYRAITWQKQLHLFEVPFYYIEYGIAQLGAIGMWMQFMKNNKNALSNYLNALSLGGTRTLVELFETAGLKFDFSPVYIKSLMEFVHQQMEEL